MKVMITINVKKQDGVSLLEVMLAVAVFVIAVASVAHLLVGAQTASGYSISKMQAIVLAREKIEEVREQRNTDGFDSLTEGTTTETVNLSDRSYETEVVISCHADEVCATESTVSWTTRGRSESVYLIEHLTAWEDVEVLEEPVVE